MSAAATLAREAAEYARSPRARRRRRRPTRCGRRSSGATAAKQHLERGAPPEIAENALLAAILAFGEVGQYARVGRALPASSRSSTLEALAHASTTRAPRSATHSVADEPLERRSRRRPRTLRQDAHFTTCGTSTSSSGSSRAAPPRRAPTCCSTRAGRAHPAQGDARAPHRAAASRRSRTASDGRGHRGAACASPSSSRSCSSTPCSRRSRRSSPARAAREDRGPQAHADALLQAQLRHVARRRSRDADPLVQQRAAETVERAAFPARVRPALAHRPRVREPPSRGPRRSGRSRTSTRARPPSFCSACSSTAAPPDRMAALAAVREAPARQFVELARVALSTAGEPLRSALRELLVAPGILSNGAKVQPPPGPRRADEA